MKFKLSRLTILLILLSFYFIYLSTMEYKASNIAEDFYNEWFEVHLDETVGIPSNYISMTQLEREEWEEQNTIKEIQNQITDNSNMDTYILWLIRARIHLQIALIFIFLAIISLKIDSLKNQKIRGSK